MNSRAGWSVFSGWLLVVGAAVAAGAGCSSTASSNGNSPSTANDAGTSTGDEKATDDPPPANEDAGTTAPKCDAPPTKSKCGNEGGWVLGTAHFDGSKFKAGTKPILRVSLRHKFTLFPGEEAIGGRLHAAASYPIKNPSTGELKFALDMCMFGTAMWSEENDMFHLVMSIDENGNNDVLSAATNEDAVTAGTIEDDELAKMVEVDVSCHNPASCVDVTLDCKGKGCLTFDPMTKCAKKTPGCSSDDAFCK